MSVGPLRRVVGVVGLVALLPTAAMLALGSITLADAAVRAAVTVGAVVLVGRLVAWWLRANASRLEASGDDGDDGDDGGGRDGTPVDGEVVPRRRRGDR